MSDNFEHKPQVIELVDPLRPLYRVTVPGGWLYSWVSGLCFVPTEEDTEALQRRIAVLELENREGRASVEFLTTTAIAPAQYESLKNALKDIRSKPGITLKEAQKIAGNAISEVLNVDN